MARIEDITEIYKTIKTPEPSFITKAKKEHRRLNTLVNGVKVPEYLSKVEGYENDDQFTLRKKFGGTVKHVFENLLRAVDKVFSAKGGSRIYGVGNSDTAEKALKSRLSNISSGLNTKQWIEDIQANKYYSDPTGLVFFEWEDNETYPTVKSILTIRNYSFDGRSVDWVLFEPEIRTDANGRQLRGEYFRFVNHDYDYTFHKDGESIILIEDETYKNPWGRCPAFTNSDILNHTLQYWDSPLDKVVDLADKYLRGQSTRNIYEQVLMYPVAWMYEQPCGGCKGTGEIQNEVCGTCNGTGGSMKRDVSNMLVLKTPKDSDSPTIAPDVAGFGQVQLDPYVESRDELKWIGDVMSFTLWGSAYDVSKNDTATAAFLDVQPVQDKQGKFSNAFEDTEKRITDFIGEFYLKQAYNPNGTSINWGRRFLMESPDMVLDKYIEAKEKNAPKVSLDHLLNQYYQSEFANDSQTLSIMIKGMKIEPFVHKSDEEVQKLGVKLVDYNSKLYFNEWWVTLDEQYVLITPPEKLRLELNKYITDKQLEDEQKSDGLQAEDSQSKEG